VKETNEAELVAEKAPVESTNPFGASFFNGIGQKRKSSRRAFVVRLSPDSDRVADLSRGLGPSAELTSS
jgi:hypothetical protein